MKSSTAETETGAKARNYKAPPRANPKQKRAADRMKNIASVAQWIEYCPPKAGVAGWIPAGRTSQSGRSSDAQSFFNGCFILSTMNAGQTASKPRSERAFMAWLACAERALRPLMRACRRSHSGALVVAVLLTACAAGPKPLDRDGPAAKPPADLAKVPDAEPRVEPIRPGGPNKPYEVLGKDYTPLDGDKPLIERGLASW